MHTKKKKHKQYKSTRNGKQRGHVDTTTTKQNNKNKQNRVNKSGANKTKGTQQQQHKTIKA